MQPSRCRLSTAFIYFKILTAALKSIWSYWRFWDVLFPKNVIERASCFCHRSTFPLYKISLIRKSSLSIVFDCFCLHFFLKKRWIDPFFVGLILQLIQKNWTQKAPILRRRSKVLCSFITFRGKFELVLSLWYKEEPGSNFLLECLNILSNLCAVNP